MALPLGIKGLTNNPDEAWMQQIARNLTDTEDGFLLPSSRVLRRPSDALDDCLSLAGTACSAPNRFFGRQFGIPSN
jgi:hypothetical protein